MSDKLSKSKKVIYALGGLAVAGAIAGATYFFMNQDSVRPEDLYTDEQMIKAVRELKKAVFPASAALSERSMKFTMMITQQMAQSTGQPPQSIKLAEEHYQMIEQLAKSKTIK